MTLDRSSVLNTQQCFLIFFCSVDTETMSNLSRKNYNWKVSTNFNSQNVIASFHIPSGKTCAKMTSCLLLRHFSNFP